MKPTLLIVEDEEALQTQMRWALDKDHEVQVAGTQAEALEILDRDHPAVVTLDLGLPPDPDGVTEGLACLQEMLAFDSGIKVVVITGNSDRAPALKAVELGAWDYCAKPVNLEELRVILNRAHHMARLEQENRELREREAAVPGFGGMLGTSQAMQRVFDVISRIGTTDAPVLIVGENGTGKELAAQAIHARSARAREPFIPINCAAIPSELLEAELFGHEKGAFTGAHVQRRGRLEYAQGGTLFLDEIGELPLRLQVKLLRFLQDQHVERVGGREAIAVDARILAATNRNLEAAIREGAFREDLYYRLGVVTIHVPPLRDRGEDLLLLARAFLHRYVKEHRRKVRGFSPTAVVAMEAHSWPGNVRELENRVKRGVIMAEGSLLEPMDLDLGTTEEGQPLFSLKAQREALERHLVVQVLERHQGNISQAARELQVSRPKLHELINRYGLKSRLPSNA